MVSEQGFRNAFEFQQAAIPALQCNNLPDPAPEEPRNPIGPLWALVLSCRMAKAKSKARANTAPAQPAAKKAKKGGAKVR